MIILKLILFDYFRITNTINMNYQRASEAFTIYSHSSMRQILEVVWLLKWQQKRKGNKIAREDNKMVSDYVRVGAVPNFV